MKVQKGRTNLFLLFAQTSETSLLFLLSQVIGQLRAGFPFSITSSWKPPMIPSLHSTSPSLHAVPRLWTPKSPYHPLLEHTSHLTGITRVICCPHLAMKVCVCSLWYLQHWHRAWDRELTCRRHFLNARCRAKHFPCMSSSSLPHSPREKDVP